MFIEQNRQEDINKVRNHVANSSRDLFEATHFEENDFKTNARDLKRLHEASSHTEQLTMNVLKKRRELKDQYLKESIVDTLSKAYFESVQLDKAVKEIVEDELLDQGREVVTFAIEEQGLYNFMNVESVTLNELYYLLEEKAEAKAEEETNLKPDNKEDEPKKVKGKLGKSTNKVKANVKTVTGRVKDKVKKVLKKEKEIAEKNKESQEELEQLKEENASFAYHDSMNIDTLFRNMNEQIAKNYLVELNEDGLTAELTTEAAKIAFDETIIQYTLLEFVNTFEIYNIDPTTVRSLLNHYKYSK